MNKARYTRTLNHTLNYIIIIFYGIYHLMILHLDYM